MQQGQVLTNEYSTLCRNDRVIVFIASI